MISHEAFSAGATCRSGAVLTVGLRADEAGGGAVEEGEQAGHGQADVRVGRPEVEGGETGEVNLQDVLRSHLNIGHLHGDTHISLIWMFLEYTLSHFKAKQNTQRGKLGLFRRCRADMRTFLSGRKHF